MLRLVCFGLLLGQALLFAVGCGGKPSPVSFNGEIKVDGAPLPNAIINFYPAEGGSINPKGIATGQSDSAGKFSMKTAGEGDGVLPGKYKVTVVAETSPPPKPGALPHESMSVPKKSLVNTDYNSFEKTPLIITVPAASTTLEVKGPGK